MHVQLRNDIPKCGHIEFVERTELAQRSAGVSNFVEQLVLLGSFQVGQFTQAVDARHKDQPWVA